MPEMDPHALRLIREGTGRRNQHGHHRDRAGLNVLRGMEKMIVEMVIGEAAA